MKYCELQEKYRDIYLFNNTREYTYIFRSMVLNDFYLGIRDGIL